MKLLYNCEINNSTLLIFVEISFFCFPGVWIGLRTNTVKSTKLTKRRSNENNNIEFVVR